MLQSRRRRALKRRLGKSLDRSIPPDVLELLYEIGDDAILRLVVENLSCIVRAHTKLIVTESCHTVESGDVPVGGGIYGWAPADPSSHTTHKRIDAGRKGNRNPTLKELGYEDYSESESNLYGETTRSFRYQLTDEVDIASLSAFLGSLTSFAPAEMEILALKENERAV